MIVTASTLIAMFSLIQKDPFFEEVLRSYLSNKNERNEFRQELHLTICEMGDKAIKYWNEGSFKWIYCGIIKNNICSSNSRWHYKYRKKEYALYEDIEGFQIEELDFIDDELSEEEKDAIKKEKLELIKNIISKQIKINPILKRDFALFELYYLKGMTYRAISAKTKISLMACHIYIKNAREIIKKEIEINK